MRISIILLLLFCAQLSAQTAPPGRPDRPDRPDRPNNPATERLVERQLDRALQQLDRATERTPQAAANGLNTAEQHVQRAAQRAQVASLGPPHAQRFSEIDLAMYQERPAVKREWLLVISDSELAQLQYHATPWQQYISSQQPLALLQAQILTLRVPQELDNLTSLAQLLPAALLTKISRNYLFEAQGSAAEQRDATESWRFRQPLCRQGNKIGLVDSEILTSHPAFAGNTKINQRNFSDRRFAADQYHATAIASILVGNSDQHLALLPNTQLYTSNVFFNTSNLQTQSTLLSVVNGLNWLAQEQVNVINMSLSGPDNPVLQLAIQALHQARIILVAAVGNEGPAAPARYPAAYPEVIAVTAIDRHGKPYRWAVRGEHIDFAAPGVNLHAAAPAGGWHTVSGTSYASPIVAAYIACLPNLAQLDLTEIKAQLKLLAVNQESVPTTPVKHLNLIPGSEG